MMQMRLSWCVASVAEIGPVRHRQNSQQQPTKASNYTTNPRISDCNDHNQLEPIRPE